LKSRTIGLYGEDKASEFLLKKGYKILKRNFRHGRREIDIIAKSEERLVFVEVKLRKDHTYGNPENFLTEDQKNRIKEAAEEFIVRTNWMHDIRFDIIAIDNSSHEILHFQDAF
jgi:putative endonuclease